jgi:hypothetical protein
MTQTQQIRAHLLKNNSIDPMTALRKFGCMRLAARIEELRRSGFSVQTAIVTKNGRRYGKYVMG